MKVKAVLMLIALLFGITFSASIVSATLSIRNIVSSNDISYRATNDTILINASSSSNVSIGDTPCIKSTATTYICTITDTVNAPTATYQLTNTEGDSGIATIKVDNNIGSVNYTVTNEQNNVFLDYTVQDLGYNNNNACSGIATINVYDGTSIINTIDMNSTPGSCSASGTINLSVSNSGTKSLSLEVIDNVGNKKSTPSQNISIDISPPEILSGLTVTYSGSDEELGVISSSASFAVDIHFSFREDNPKSIILDLSNANNNPAVQYAYKNLELPLSNCAINDTTASDSVKVYDCVIRGVQLKLSSDTLKMGVSVTDTHDSTTTTNLTKSFTIDNVEPKVVITTDKCDSLGECYISSGENNIILTFNKENFDKRDVFFNIPGSTFGVNRIQNCSGSVCTIPVPIICTSGSLIETSIVSASGMPSQDDAGNIIQPYSTYLHCDNDAPKINNITITGDVSSIIKEIVSGSTITITALVTDFDSYELNATAMLDLIKNSTEQGTCTKTGITFNCTWTITNINDGYYKANIVINISDIVGNTASKIYTQEVLGKSDNETPKFVAATFKDVSPTNINRVVVGMATQNSIPYYIYARYSLHAISGSTDVSVMHQQLDIGECIYVGKLGTLPASQIFAQATLSNEYSAINEIGRIDFRFNDNYDPNSLDDNFKLLCNISILEKKGKTVYSKAQQVELIIPFTAINTKLCTVGQACTPGDAFGDKIKQVGDRFLVDSQLMDTLNQWIPKLQAMCNVRSTITQASQINSAITTILYSVNIAVGGKANSLLTPSVNAGVLLSKLDSCMSGSSPSQNILSIPGISGDPSADAALKQAYTTAGTTAVQNVLKTGKGTSSGTGANSGCLDIVGKACDALSCSVTQIEDKLNIAKGTSSNGVSDWFGDGSATSGNTFMQDLQKNVKVPDVGNSIVMATASTCYPAIYYNLNKYRQTSCNYLYCLKMASYTGTDIVTCEKAQSAQLCSLVVGEIFEWPGLSTIKNYANNAADLARSALPLAVMSYAKKTICAPYLDFKLGKETAPKTMAQQTFAIFGCQIPLQVARVADSTLRSNSKGFTYPSVPDTCVYAKCVGQPNCKYNGPSFTDTINQMNLNTSVTDINFAANQKIADESKDVNDLQRLKSMQNSKDKGLSDYNGAAYNQLLKSLQDRKIIPANYESPDYIIALEKSDTTLTADKTDVDNLKGKVVSAYIMDDGYYVNDKTANEKEYDIQLKINNDYSAALAKQQKDLDAAATKVVPAHFDDQIIQLNTCQLRLKSNPQDPCYENILKSFGSSVNVVSQQDFNNIQIAKNPTLYNNATIDEKVTIDTAYQTALSQLDYLNAQAGDPSHFHGLTQAQQDSLQSQRMALLQALGECGVGNKPDCAKLSKDLTEAPTKAEVDAKTASTYNYSQYSENITKELTVAKMKLVNSTRASASFQSAQVFGNGIYMALQYLNAKGMLRFMFTDYWLEKITGGKVSSDLLNFDKYKESICNPEVAINLADNSDGSVTSCSSGTCLPVLTYATERTSLQYPNGTAYNLYTTVYYLSAGDLRGRELSYNIHFNGDKTSLYGYAKDVKLNAYDVIQQKQVFIAVGNYTQMCIDFDNPFPVENDIINSKSYCRDITSDEFNTGSPWTPETEQNNTGYLNSYDANGKRININTGVPDVKAPGVFEK